jgi:hypothetical protein
VPNPLLAGCLLAEKGKKKFNFDICHLVFSNSFDICHEICKTLRNNIKTNGATVEKWNNRESRIQPVNQWETTMGRKEFL